MSLGANSGRVQNRVRFFPNGSWRFENDDRQFIELSQSNSRMPNPRRRGDEAELHLSDTVILRPPRNTARPATKKSPISPPFPAHDGRDSFIGSGMTRPTDPRKAPRPGQDQQKPGTASGEWIAGSEQKLKLNLGR